jgi:hypothetical protein
MGPVPCDAGLGVGLFPEKKKTLVRQIFKQAIVLFG